MQRLNRRHFQIAHIAVHVFAQFRAQIDDRINDKLSGPYRSHRRRGRAMTGPPARQYIRSYPRPRVNRDADEEQKV
jgi:hypothetical protein